MNKAVAFAGGMGVGAGMMYFLDPDRGRRRRALIKDKAVSTVRDLDDDIRTAARNLKNRATGIVAEARSLVSREQIPDRILQARVESKLGRLSSHPHAISVTADDGEITLNGAALSDEVERVVRGISGMRGVVHVRNRLEVHTRSESIPQLQGGRRRRIRSRDCFRIRCRILCRIRCKCRLRRPHPRRRIRTSRGLRPAFYSSSRPSSLLLAWSLLTVSFLCSSISACPTSWRCRCSWEQRSSSSDVERGQPIGARLSWAWR